jgi:hypothetical protein
MIPWRLSLGAAAVTPAAEIFSAMVTTMRTYRPVTPDRKLECLFSVEILQRPRSEAPVENRASGPSDRACWTPWTKQTVPERLTTSGPPAGPMPCFPRRRQPAATTRRFRPTPYSKSPMRAPRTGRRPLAPSSSTAPPMKRPSPPNSRGTARRPSAPRTARLPCWTGVADRGGRRCHRPRGAGDRHGTCVPRASARTGP